MPVRESGALPAAIVLGVETPMGLTVVRELGERGAPVHAIGSKRALGMASRWVTERHQRPGDFSELIRLINDIAEACGPSVLMAMSDQDSVKLREAADAGNFRNINLLVPPVPTLKLTQDKEQTYRIAR